MVKQEVERGVEGKMVCKQRYKGRDGDEDLSEDAIIHSRTEGVGGGDLGKCSSADAKMVKCCSERKIERVKGQRETQRMIHRVRPVELLPEGVQRCLPAPPASLTASLSSPPTAIYNLCKPVTSALNEARKRLQVFWAVAASQGRPQSQ